jgi:hypothetical protein
MKCRKRTTTMKLKRTTKKWKHIFGYLYHNLCRDTEYELWL